MVQLMADAPTSVVEWAARGRPYLGEMESGDRYVAEPFAGGMLLGIIDGLGHGPEAAVPSRRAVTMLAGEPGKPVLDLMRGCHEALRGTRGAVVSLASIQAGQLNWIGVGNAEAVLIRADPAASPRKERVLLRGGVVGYQLPPLRATTLPIHPGDMLLLATDGLRHEFSEEDAYPGSPAEWADHLLRTYGKDSDDALILVARYTGEGA